MSDAVRQQVEQQIDIPLLRKKVSMVDLPLGATEDRVCGTIDIEKPFPKVLKLLNRGYLQKQIEASSTSMKSTC
jgi:magnesium chelatase subunit I